MPNVAATSSYCEADAGDDLAYSARANSILSGDTLLKTKKDTDAKNSNALADRKNGRFPISRGVHVPKLPDGFIGSVLIRLDPHSPIPNITTVSL